MKSIVKTKDFAAGVLFFGIGLAGLWLGRDFAVGTAQSMGPGYVPRLVCWGLMLLGAAVTLQAVLGRSQALADWDWRPFIFVPGSVLAFGFLVERAGLVVATVVLIAVGSLAARDIRWRETAIAAVALAAFTALAFVVGLGLQINLWPEI